MMITAELASLHRLATERRRVAQDDSPQPVVASSTLSSRRPVLVPEGTSRVEARDEREDEASRESAEVRHDRRQGDRQGASGEQRNDRRKQTLPTLIDTRSTRARRQSDNETVIDFAI